MDLDVTFLFQFGIFLVALVAMSNILLKPFLIVIEERESKIAGAQAEVESLTVAAKDFQGTYQVRMREAQQQALKTRDGFKAEGKEERSKLLTTTRESINQKLADNRAKITASEVEARGQLIEESAQLAQLVVDKVAGQQLGAQ